MQAYKPLLLLAAFASLAYGSNCLPMVSQEQAMECCHSMPCSPHDGGTDCCKSMASPGAFILPPSEREIRLDVTLIALVPLCIEHFAMVAFGDGIGTQSHDPPAGNCSTFQPIRV